MSEEIVADSSPELLEQLLDGNPSLGLMEPETLTLYKDGSVEIGLTILEKHTNVYKAVHGGIFATLLDTVMGYASHAFKQSNVVTLNLTTSFLGNCQAGTKVRVIGRAVHGGRRIVVAEGEVRDDKGTLLVTAQGSFFVLAKEVENNMVIKAEGN